MDDGVIVEEGPPAQLLDAPKQDALAARDAAPDPLTPARHRLRQAIAAVDRARREVEAAAEQLL